MLLFLVIFLHLSIRKCMNRCNDETLNDMENQQIDEEFEYIPSSSTFIITTVLLFLSMSLKHSTSNFRFSLLLQDSLPIPVLSIYLVNLYFKNPYLRKYVWKNSFNLSSVRPQTIPIDIELQTIY